MAERSCSEDRSQSSSLEKQSHMTQSRVHPRRVARRSCRTDHERPAWCRQSMRCNSRSRYHIFTVFAVLISLLNVTAAQSQPQGAMRRAWSYAELGPRRIMERATESTATEETTTTMAHTTTSKTSTKTTPTTLSIRRTSSSTPASAKSTTLPQPFDTSLGNNFTTIACPNFFSKFLSDSTFQSCYPFSLLLETSHGFFQDEKNFYDVTKDLQASCTVNATVCNDLMQSLAIDLISSDNCGSDYGKENPLVMQAYTGMIAYPVMYQASCLKTSAGDYCFADAITLQDNSTVSDAYPYYLPLGTTLPGGARPSCTTCLKDTIQIFQSFASNKTQPISKTYAAAAQNINMGCGPNWVASTVEMASASTPLAMHYSASLLSLLISFSLAISWT